MSLAYDVPHNRWQPKPEYFSAVRDVLEFGHVGFDGPQTMALEQELASLFRPDGAACCVSSGTAALWLAYVLAGSVGTVPTYACAALWLAAREAGMPGPMLADCDEEFQTPMADVVVHTYGGLSDMRDAAIEDFTHAPGALGAGTYGALSVISFGATKPLGVGGGGALLGPVDKVATARSLRDYDKWDGEARSYNCQMSDIHAAMVRVRLRYLDEENTWRRRVAAQYTAALTEVGVGHIAPEPRDVFYRYVIKVGQPAQARARLNALGIEAINPLLPDELLHRRLRISGRHFPMAEKLVHRTLSLPIWPGMAEAQVQKVVDALRTFGDLA